MMDQKLEQLFYTALGGALTVKERIEANNEEMKAWQEKSEEHARVFFEDLARRGEQEKDEFRKMLKDVVQDIVVDLNLATRDDLKKLKKDLEKQRV